jgi:hypothetical protein
MYSLVIAELNEEVKAFKGTISPQNEASVYMNPNDQLNYKKKYTKSVFFPGGNSQVYIPLFQKEDNVETDKNLIEMEMMRYKTGI